MDTNIKSICIFVQISSDDLGFLQNAAFLAQLATLEILSKFSFNYFWVKLFLNRIQSPSYTKIIQKRVGSKYKSSKIDHNCISVVCAL